MRTSSRRSGIRVSGTSMRMPVATILRFARTIRWASVASGTRKARATCSVVRPATDRRVRARRTSTANAGWQQPKSIATRSSVSDHEVAGSGGPASSTRAATTAAASRPRAASRRSRSTALRRAVRVSQAPGLGGGPSRRHAATAETRASCTASSATSKSPVRRCRAATTGPASRRTASTRTVSARSPSGSGPVAVIGGSVEAGGQSIRCSTMGRTSTAIPGNPSDGHDRASSRAASRFSTSMTLNPPMASLASEYGTVDDDGGAVLPAADRRRGLGALELGAGVDEDRGVRSRTTGRSGRRPPRGAPPERRRRGRGGCCT